MRKIWLILLGGLIFAGIVLAGGLLPSKFSTTFEKTLLKFKGGPFVVKVYTAGNPNPVVVYRGNGYVWFEEGSSGKAHTGVVTFVDSQGRIIRIGAWGGVVIVEYLNK